MKNNINEEKFNEYFIGDKEREIAKRLLNMHDNGNEWIETSLRAFKKYFLLSTSLLVVILTSIIIMNYIGFMLNIYGYIVVSIIMLMLSFASIFTSFSMFSLFKFKEKINDIINN